MPGGEGTEGAASRKGATRRLGWPWLAAVGAAVVCAVGGGLWLGRGPGGPTAEATAADCSASLSVSPAGLPRSSRPLSPLMVGVGPYASIAVFKSSDGALSWCFDGMGVGTAPVPLSALRGPVAVPLVLQDMGGSSRELLALVHHGARTTDVVVDVAHGQSRVLASGAGFEVLAVPLPGDLHWHAPWPASPAVLGQVVGFDGRGVVTGTERFAVCPGSIDSFPGGC